MRRVLLILTLFAMAFTVLGAASSAFADEKEDAANAERAVKNYEERVEELSKEVASIREELEDLTRQMLEGETGRVFIFMRGRVSDWVDRAVALDIDGETLVSRPLTPAELNVLGGDLPLELLELRLAAGEHSLLFGPKGELMAQPVKMKVERAKRLTWIVTYEDGTARWEVE
ncbi:MAG: hypothetical protein C0609_04890 [Deltaproteobacteria bacterium]|nr:MAG: hypothetical protein C0609_04890 [Deltaproteobacteria bacterium]